MTRLYTDDAELYDIAFDWDIAEETDWIVEVLAAASVLEPGCGSGRMLEALAKRGVKVVESTQPRPCSPSRGNAWAASGSSSRRT